MVSTGIIAEKLDSLEVSLRGEMSDLNTSEGYEESFDHEWPPSDEEIDRWMDENEKFLALNENDGSIRA